MPLKRPRLRRRNDMTIRHEWLLLIFALCLMGVFAGSAHAQLGLPGATNALTISFSPADPQPQGTVDLQVQSSIFDIGESAIVWRINGKTTVQGKGASSASASAGALGSETLVEVSVTAQDGTMASARTTIIPTELDLLIDADSYVPPFYRGRPRPSAGTNLRVQALPHFKRAGTFLSASALTYTWRRNGDLLGSLSGRGKSSAIIPVEHLYGSDTISVEVRSDDGLLSHTASLSLAATEPIIELYEDHPLYGVLYNRALPASAFVNETEMTFVAVPFFVQAKSLYDPALSFSWRVNTANIPPNLTDPNKITINAKNSSGIALVELGLTHASNYYLDVKDAWNITFSSEAGANDQFHSTAQ